MADGLRPGWEYDNKNDNTNVIKAKVPQTTTVGSSEKIEIVSNVSTGNFDIYETRLIGPRPANPIFSYNASNDKITIKDRNAYNLYYSSASGKKQLENILKSSKLATFDNAQLLTGTDSVRNQNFIKIKNTKGYSSISNITKEGNRAPGTSPDFPPLPGSSGGSGGTDEGQQNTLASLSQPLEDLSSQFSRIKKIQYKEPLRYPLSQSKEETYDYLKINVIEYVKSGLIQDKSTISLTRPSERLRNQDIIGTVILPMQPNISDSNGVSWNEDQLNALQGAFAAAAYRGISSSSQVGDFPDFLNWIKSLGTDLSSTLGSLANDPGLSTLISGYFAGQAVGANVLPRVTGAVINNNLELLFQGPKLRTFRYNYRFTPREPKEANRIKDIIRLFKREMSTSRSDTGLFLQTPNVFKLEYIYNNGKEGKNIRHPFLNIIKPCALTNFNVNYTPDGTYMTYGDGGSMTSYTVEMEFSELEPIYKEDYDSGDGVDGMGY